MQPQQHQKALYKIIPGHRAHCVKKDHGCVQMYRIPKSADLQADEHTFTKLITLENRAQSGLGWENPESYTVGGGGSRVGRGAGAVVGLGHLGGDVEVVVKQIIELQLFSSIQFKADQLNPELSITGSVTNSGPASTGLALMSSGPRSLPPLVFFLLSRTALYSLKLKAHISQYIPSMPLLASLFRYDSAPF